MGDAFLLFQLSLPAAVGDVVYVHGFVRCLKGPFEAKVVVL